MKLGILWDPQNPIVPVADIVTELHSLANVHELTFELLAHRTSPNGSFEIAAIVEKLKLDALLWIEGGPVPKDLPQIRCHKTCWLLNSDLEPTLAGDANQLFDTKLSAVRTTAMEPGWKWVPCAAERVVPQSHFGIRYIGSDPIMASNVATYMECFKLARHFGELQVPIAVCSSVGKHPPSRLFSILSSGAVTLIESSTDLRDIAHPGDHILSYASPENLKSIIEGIACDDPTAWRIMQRGIDIVTHLHTPKLRAEALLEAHWPSFKRLNPALNRQPRISVLTNCYKYRRRLEYYLKSIASQELPAGEIEVVITDPESPDGLLDFLTEFSRNNSHLQITYVPTSLQYFRNRGFCINKAFEASRGEIIISTDGDIVFPRHLIGELARSVIADPSQVYGVRRCFMNRSTTESILANEIDPVAQFKRLAERSGDGEPEAREGVLGYCQALARGAFRRAGYPTEFDQVNQSDIVFLERLQEHCRVTPCILHAETVLHLWHPRDWSGTKNFL